MPAHPANGVPDILHDDVERTRECWRHVLGALDGTRAGKVGNLGCATVPPVTDTTRTSRSAESSLRRSIGTFALAASIVNVTIGGGIFRLPADMAATLGATAPIAYLLCAIAMGLIVLCMAEAGSRVSMTGGPYAYVEVAFGPFVGFLAGFLLWMLLTFAMAAVATVLAASLGALVPALASRAASAAVLVAIYAVFATINILGVERGARVNTALTIAKILPLLLLIVGGLFAIDAGQPRDPSTRPTWRRWRGAASC